MDDPIQRPPIAEALEARDFTAVKRILTEVEPQLAADWIEELEDADRAVAFRLLGHEPASEVFEYLDAEVQEDLIRALGRDQVASIVNEMSPDDRTALLEELPAAATRQVLNMLAPDERGTAVQLLGYPEDSVGRLMTPDYVRIKEHWSIRQAFEHIRKHGRDSETLNVIYVIDDRGKLIDDVRIRFLLLADPDARVSDVTDGSYVALSAFDDQERAVALFGEYDRVALPVVDSRGVLLGIVTFDDIMDVAEEEATEDIQKIGAVEALDDPYIRTPIGEVVRKRGVWLILLFLGQMLTVNVVEHFESRLAAFVMLVAYIPVIIATGGNTGAQAATLLIRSLALGEVRLRDWWRVMRREVLSGLALGAIVGGIGFLKIAFDHFVLQKYPDDWAVFASAIAASIVVVVLWGTLVGSMLPFVLQRLGFDPAASSTPFVATLVDVTGLIIYFSLSLAIMATTVA